MDENIKWTKRQQENTLVAIEIMKAYFKGDREVSTATTNRYLSENGADAVISGLSNLNAVLINQIRLLTKNDPIQVLYDAEHFLKNDLTIEG